MAFLRIDLWGQCPHRQETSETGFEETLEAAK